MPQLELLPNPVRARRPVWRPVVAVKPSPPAGAAASSVVLIVTERLMSTVTLNTCGLVPPEKLTVSVKLMVEGLGTLPLTMNWNGTLFVVAAPGAMFDQVRAAGGMTVTPGVLLVSVPVTLV